MLFQVLFLITIFSGLQSEPIRLRKCVGTACPYTGSWLINSESFEKVSIYLHSLKMEEATFKMMWIRNIYQVHDKSMYFVNHLSQYEHETQTLLGYDYAMNVTHTFSVAAADGECSQLAVSDRQSLIAFIPFFGGLPPNTTSDHTVKSIGQGNSLARIDSKALQCMATTCSLLKFTRRVVIGVARDEDYSIIEQMLEKYKIRQYVTIKQFQMVKFANLPFHLLSWGRTYVVENNCRFVTNNDLTSQHAHIMNYCTEHSKRHMSYPHAHPSIKDDMLGRLYVSHAYYTESDTILYATNTSLMDFMIAATNVSTAFMGARRNKQGGSNPSEYMGDLEAGRHCGAEGYSMNFPTTPVVQYSPPVAAFSRLRGRNRRHE